MEVGWLLLCWIVACRLLSILIRIYFELVLLHLFILCIALTPFSFMSAYLCGQTTLHCCAPFLLHLTGFCDLHGLTNVRSSPYGFLRNKFSRSPWNIFKWRWILPRLTDTWFTQLAWRVQKPLLVTWESLDYPSPLFWVWAYYRQFRKSDSKWEF